MQSHLEAIFLQNHKQTNFVLQSKIQGWKVYVLRSIARDFSIIRSS